MKQVKYLLTAIMLVSMLAAAMPVGASSGVENPTVPNWWTLASPPPPVKAPPPTTPVERGNPPVAFLGVDPAAPASHGIESLSGSNVTFDPSAGGATCAIPGATQTFCFNAHSYTNDWEYVYNVWLRFPPDWTVTNAYVMGTPTCSGGGSWGTFSWSFETAPYEINIAHPRYQSTTDDCVATYCVDVVAGTGVPYAYESWYWDGDEYGSPPHAPCSSDNYTPPSMASEPCDQAVNPPAAIPPCAMDPGVYLLPPTQEAEGCNGVPQEHTLSLYNNTGLTGTFAMSYSVPSGNGTLTGPAAVVANNGESVPFTVTLTPDLCTQPGAEVIAQIDTSGNGFTDSATITKTVTTEPHWEAIPASAPSWPGYGYPRDGCTALNAASQWVTYQFGDTTSYFGFWGYNHATNTWFQPNPTGTPADRWAPDWAYDPETNLCYVTGGATTPGGGNLNDAYVYDPVANTFTALGNFTSMRDFHNSWVGRIDGTKYLCIGGGVNASSVLVQSTQCYDLAQAAPGVWNAENAQMAAFPTDPFGAADGVLHAPTGDQFWYVGGAINNFATVTDEARYWDDADNAWHLAGNTGAPRYRVEGDFFNGDFYQLGGSSGGFSPTDTVVRGHFDGVGWTWSAMPSLNNIRMDNVVALAEGTIWSNDGYGASSSAYVEKLVSCPICDLQGWLEGTVLDGDTQPPLIGWKPAAPMPPEGGWAVQPAADLVGIEAAAGVAPSGPVTLWSYPEAVLWDNGPLVTHPGNCAGMDASRLQTDLGMNTIGFGHQFSVGNRMADDFTISDPGGWQIDTITFFAYQTNAPSSPSPITGVYYQIWDGPPNDPGSSVIFGDLVTNRLITSTFTNIQRDSGTSTCANNRYIFADVASAGVTLPPGSYWLDWMTDGSLASGPWAPPITILGQTTTGNALQYTTSSGAWGPANDSGTGTQQGMPFIIEGAIGGGSLNPPCRNATVTINPGNITVAVDPATGHYGPVMLIQGDYTVEATAPGYSTESAAVTITDEMTTTQHFILWRPVVDVDPLAISVSSPPSVPVTVPLTITNLGHLELDWEILEVPTGMAVEMRPAASGLYRQTPAQFGVDPFIVTQMAEAADGNADFFIAFRDTADLSGAYAIRDRAERVQWVRNALRSAADRAQARVRAWLDAQGISYQVFTVDNTILVHGNRALLESLQAQFPEISGFHGNHTYSVLPLQSPTMGPLPEDEAAAPEYAAPSWDLNIMNVPQVWDELGVTGEDVIVANVDTGVAYQHPALFPNYLCGSGPHTDCWLDPDGGTTTPNDGNGHGTGTMSQMAADNADSLAMSVGGAPDAGWIACLGCPGGSCPDTALNACADWLVNTTPNTPHVVNNSWGAWSAVCDYWYQGKLQAYRAAGILPVFAAGNIGNACNTSTPPANNPEAFAVGATTNTDVQASFSSTGPGLCTGRTQFPDVAAPGDATCGATTSGGFSCGLSGTSFAAPRAAGCLALMFSANPGLTIDQAEDILMATADDKPNSDCGSPQPDPNYRYGDGRVNCYEAVLAAGAADLDWVSTDPVTGTIPGLEEQVVDVIFHCTPDQQGLILSGVLRVNHNDPCEDPVDIPIELTCGQPTAPDIEVVPTDLSTTLVSGEQDVQTLNINNLGSLPLDWNIIEHNPLAGSMAFVPVNVRGGDANGETLLRVHSPTPLALVQPEAPANPDAVLWDQPLSAVNQDAYVDQDFSDYPAYSSFLADDFVNAAPWAISTIFVPGNGWNGFTTLLNADSLTWQIYADCAGVPCGDPAGGGSAPVWTLTLPPTDAQVTITNGTGGMPSNTTLNLATPLSLPVGHWWLVFYPTMGFASGGQYGCQPADTTNGYTAQFINPGGGFGYGTAWQAWTVLGPTQQDIAFRLEGEVWLPPECEPVDIPWASVDPITGTTPGHDTFEVDVTFDSTGMTGGVYNANLCVASNDPDEPYVIVPLEMTVLDPQDIVVTPESLEATLCPTSTTVMTVTICNAGDLDLDWALAEAEWPLAISSPYVPVNVAGRGVVNTAIALSSPARPLAPVAPAANPDAVLWDQPLSTVNQNAYVDQDFTDSPDYSSFLADDFINADNWYIDTIFIPGDGWNGFTTLLNATALTWQIYADAGGVPDGDPAGGGNAPLWTLTLAPTDPMVVISNGSGGLPSNTTLNLPSPVTVPPGHWWLVFYPTMEFGSGGQYGRQPADTTNGYTGQFINPGGGFGYGTTWQAWSVIGPTQQDIAFRLEGSAVPPYDIPWLSEDPTSGTLLGDECQDVAATFDSTGLAEGVYTGALLITSNDPDTPDITVPVTLTVVPCGGCVELESAIFTFDPLAPLEGQLVTFTGDYLPISATLPITFTWDFGDGDSDSGQVVTHAFASYGTYLVALTVDNPCSQVVYSTDVNVYTALYLPIIMRNSQ